jgi:hypothetical protein
MERKPLLKEERKPEVRHVIRRRQPELERQRNYVNQKSEEM